VIRDISLDIVMAGRKRVFNVEAPAIRVFLFRSTAWMNNSKAEFFLLTLSGRMSMAESSPFAEGRSAERN